MEVNLAQVPHRLRPQFLESIAELLRKILVTHQERSKTALRNERMVEAEDHHILINDMEGVTEFSGVAHAGDMFQVRPVLAQKSNQLWSRSVAETKDDSLV